VTAIPINLQLTIPAVGAYINKKAKEILQHMHDANAFTRGQLKYRPVSKVAKHLSVQAFTAVANPCTDQQLYFCS